MPSFLMKKWVLSHIPSSATEGDIADCIDFVVEQVSTVLYTVFLVVSPHYEK